MFSRSKRFANDKSSCAPPPGHYNPKDNTRLPGPVTFKKSPREKPTKNIGPSVGQYNPKRPDSPFKCSTVKTPGLRTNQSSTSSLFSRAKSSTNNDQITAKNKRKSQSTSNLQVINKFDINIIDVDENVTRSVAYRQRIVELERALKELRNENQRLMDLGKENSDERELLSIKLHDMRCDQDLLVKQVEVLEREKISQCADLHRVEDENQELIGKFTVVEMQLRQNNERYAEQLAAIQRSLQDCVERNERLQSTNAEYLEEKEKMLIEVTELKESRNSLERRLAESEEEIRDHIKNYQHLKDNYQKLSDELQAKNENLMRMESAQAAFQEQITQCKNKIISGDNDYRVLNQKYETMSERLNTKEKELLQVKEKCLSAANQSMNFENKIAEYEKINATLLKKNDDLAELIRIKEIEMQKSEYNDNLIRELERQVNNHRQDNQRLTNESLGLKNVIVQNDSQLLQFHKEIKSMKVQLKELQNIHAYANVMSSELTHVKTLLKSAVEESASYKSQLDELTSRIEPFKEQLEMYYAERNTLISMENESELKVKKLFDQYANLLTHQNNKQKIHHVIKLKEENLKCRSEVATLRKELARSKATAELYKTKIDHLQGKRRFDPKLAFQHNKENDDPCEN